MSNLTDDTKSWYTKYYRSLGRNRNDLRSNPEVLFQTLAQEAAIVRSATYLQHDPADATILDVGCGGGGNIFQLIRLGYRYANITGIDINDERIAIGKADFPLCHFFIADASQMFFSDNSFDLIYESTMFSTLPDEDLCIAISREMVRVCKKGGYLLLVDWRYKKSGSTKYNALNRKKVKTYFGVSQVTDLISVEAGALVPPLGRFLSKYIPSLYFLVAALLPFSVGQIVYILKKR